MSFIDVPLHLKKYVVEQDYSHYTPIDQAVWRCIMRQLRAYLSEHAHPCYLEGLKKTGIEVDHIPRIEDVSLRLQSFGWKAVAVSGFIPPAAFMELQAHGFLPIASDMRTIDHLLYTPAPDIVHEAAGHAPILVDQAFASYLRSYAQVARKAIVNKKDLELYEAIRNLSDLKESPTSTPEQIAAAEATLSKISANMGEPSEAALLGRMNWWTAEYGLIGDLKNPRIFGAGLLSSVGEARSCLSPNVKKIPLSLDCINYSYDITEMQPQLFVTPDFETLTRILNEMSSTLAYRKGGVEGLTKAKQAQTINTAELNSGLQISGVVKDFIVQDEEPVYLQFDGPSQLSVEMKQLDGHGRERHPQGFGSPIGMLEKPSKCLCDYDESELLSLGIKGGERTEVKYKSGVKVSGVLKSFVTINKKVVLLTFTDCTVTLGNKILFDPAWGEYDMAVGSKVVSVFGGPADREQYGFRDDFVAKMIPRKTFSKEELAKHRLYAEIRKLRETVGMTEQERMKRLDELISILDERYPGEWLPRLEILEIGAEQLSSKPSWFNRLLMGLKARTEFESEDSPLRAGLKILNLN